MDEAAIAVLDEEMSCLEKDTLPVVDTTECAGLGLVEEALSLLEGVDTEKVESFSLFILSEFGLESYF